MIHSSKYIMLPVCYWQYDVKIAFSIFAGIPSVFCMQNMNRTKGIAESIAGSILCSMDDFVQSELVHKAVPFHKPLKRLQFKTFALTV